jgi:DNA-damage-inducible protein J
LNAPPPPPLSSLIPPTTLLQAGIDPDTRDRAAAALLCAGLTLSDAVRILLTPVANDGALPPGLVTDQVTHDAWFRAHVHKALANPAPPLPVAEVSAHFARRRAAQCRPKP